MESEEQMYEFKTKFSNDDDDSDWEACDVISEISSDAMCTVVSRRDGRMAFVKRENVRFLGATLVKGLKDLWNSSGSSTHDAEEENDENTKPRSASPPPPPPKNLPKLKGGKNIVRDKSPERRYVDVMSQFNTTAATSNSKKN